MQTSGLPWRFCGIVGMGDPGGGGLRFNGARAAETSTISVSDACLDRRNPDVSRYVATWDKSTNTDHRGTLMVTSAMRDGLAVFDVVGTSTDREGWTELSVRPVQSFDQFETNETVTVQFFRTGDTAGAAAVREIVREIIVQGVPSSPDTDDSVAMRAQIIQLAHDLAQTKTELRELQSAIGRLIVQARAAE